MRNKQLPDSVEDIVSVNPADDPHDEAAAQRANRGYSKNGLSIFSRRSAHGAKEQQKASARFGRMTAGQLDTLLTRIEAEPETPQNKALAGRLRKLIAEKQNAE